MPRLDRLLTLLWLRMRRTEKSSNGFGELPILMYHSISEDREEGTRAYYKVATSPARFSEQMRWLSEAGWRGVGLSEALATPPCAKSARLVAITFDDGFRDFYTQAWPALRRHGFGATMYLPTAKIGSPRQSFLGRDCLCWDEVRELRRDGVEFGSHTVNHPKLYDLDWEEIDRELGLSKQRVEEELGEQIFSFAYPYAFPREDRRFTVTLAERLRQRGYRSCATTMIGRAAPSRRQFHLPRLPINSEDDLALFSAKLQGAYDWIAVGQTAFRRARASMRGRGARASAPPQPVATHATKI